MRTNLILNTDSYKMSHYKQYPPGTTKVMSYIEARAGGVFDRSVVFGLQVFLKEYLSKPITQADIDEAEAFAAGHGEPFNKEGWQYILDNCNGYLPLRIEAVQEGTVVPNGNVLLQVWNTDPKCFWLTSYIETALLRAMWYPTTVATLSWHARQIIYDFLVRTSEDPNGQINFKLHDFGARGVSSNESAGLGGAAHLVNFMGSDTVEGVRYANFYYNAGMAGFSIPAAEHSTITSWGKSQEAAAYENMLTQFAGKGKLLAVVSDSYDLDNAVENIWGDQLRKQVLESGATLVVRPDSGDPATIVLRTIEKLGQAFGFEKNRLGYKVLNPAVRVIQGDGINLDSIREILQTLMDAGWSADNIAFGMGGALLQGVNRDTMRWAMKCNAITVDGVEREVFKNPVTDPTKRSKAGPLALIRSNGKIVTVPQANLGQTEANLLKTVYDSGRIVETTFEQVRARAAEGV
jgi:nicotinamide phosphoribosyltransferase